MGYLNSFAQKQEHRDGCDVAISHTRQVLNGVSQPEKLDEGMQGRSDRINFRRLTRESLDDNLYILKRSVVAVFSGSASFAN